jgi:Sugar (and other) transporter
MIIVMVNMGLVVGYALNSYLDYYTVPYILIVIFAIFYAGFAFVPETPKFHAMKGDFVNAKRSLQFFRGYARSDAEFSSSFEVELNLLRGLNSRKDGAAKLNWQDYFTKSARKAIFIGVFVNFLAIMSGMVAVTNYSDTIFVEAGSDLSPVMSSIVIGLILLIGATSSSLLSDRAGRRILMGGSSVGCGVILTLLAVYSHLKASGYSLQSVAWVPLACLSAFMLLSSMGITALHYLIMSEVLAQNIRGVVSSLCAFENWMLAFILVKVRSISSY